MYLEDSRYAICVSFEVRNDYYTRRSISDITSNNDDLTDSLAVTSAAYPERYEDIIDGKDCYGYVVVKMARWTRALDAKEIWLVLLVWQECLVLRYL